MLKRWFPSIVFAIGLLAAIITATLPERPQFAEPEKSVAAVAAKQAAALPARFAWSDLPRPTPSAHAATLAEVLPGTRLPVLKAEQDAAPVHLVAAWFGGSR
ncbi:MAG: hypothetical protein EBV73_05325, partial [Rhodocyclales bacterium]|nr:hypothetical protein [Rhodocyclales bacterium]